MLKIFVALLVSFSSFYAHALSWSQQEVILGAYLKRNGFVYKSIKKAGLRRVDLKNMTKFEKQPDLTILHHTTKIYTARGIEVLHRDQKGWAACGYHFLISEGLNGEVIITNLRPLTRIGAHTAAKRPLQNEDKSFVLDSFGKKVFGEKSFNWSSIGIALDGCFTTKEALEYPPTHNDFPVKMRQAYEALCAWLNVTYKWEQSVERHHHFRMLLGQGFENSPGDMVEKYYYNMIDGICGEKFSLMGDLLNAKAIGPKLFREFLKDSSKS